jgi:hypothetical protein
MGGVSVPPADLPPLPPSPMPDDLLARCRTAFLASAVRTARATLEVHRTHLRIVTPAVAEVTAYARRMRVDDLYLSFERIVSIRPVGAITAIVELPHDAAIALTGPSVSATLGRAADRVRIEPRRVRPFFVGFWLINHRPGRVLDDRPVP